jgi:hypothetical protein
MTDGQRRPSKAYNMARPRRWATGFSPKQRLQSRPANANRPTIRSSKKVNSNNESPATVHSSPDSFLEKNEFEKRNTIHRPLPTTHWLPIRSSKKTQKIFFYSKFYVNSTRQTSQQSPIIKKSSASIRVPYQPSNLQLLA